ncbi:uncharacterized protein LOC126833544 isoform X2 [Adelges cooleyi]|nr:uncharacterized protein LOC126833544 isoform X2 [Adelges cooleyi]XP_050420913.1 uncharacterized protein LOC126833544 isoform X2 [Adelges cooleyi]XP_050420914.1 uncharacterized protein LOC126833544 isoform X2 [Adelges cooleyi]
MIKEYLKAYTPLQDDYLKMYAEPEGQSIYEESFISTQKYFPQYIIELQGVADGAQVPFEELFLMALDDTLSVNLNKGPVDKGPVGCTSLIINQPYGQFLGHTEDALASAEDNYYIIAAHVLPSENESGGLFKAREEKFEALAYAGHLPGYASGHNHHGVVFSINTIFVNSPLRGRIPREFITRALLSSRANLTEIMDILINDGVGTADGFNVNLAFLDVPRESRTFHTFEVIPYDKDSRSEVCHKEFKSGNNSLHANRLLCLETPESQDELTYGSSVSRENKYKQLTKNKVATSLNDIVEVLGNSDDGAMSIYRDGPCEPVKTIHLGIFDFDRKLWIMWTKNPTDNPPLLQLPLTFVDLISSPATAGRVDTNNIDDFKVSLVKRNTDTL